MTDVSRREVLTAAACLLVPGLGHARALGGGPEDALRALERRAGGRLGVCGLDTATGRTVGNRLDERFAMCSTFKLPLAAVVLREAERGTLRLDERLSYGRPDLAPNSPVTGARVDEGAMSIVDLAEAAQLTSDNTAANLLLRRLGGPTAFTALLRASGDPVTRLDREEPALNVVLPGDVRDTTTPREMARSVARFLAGGLLSPASRQKLVGWMIATTTGLKRIRAGLPPGWTAGDKTGTAMTDAMTDKINDVAMAWPPGRAPIVIAVYYDSARRSTEMRDEDQAVLADAGRIAAAWNAT